MTWYYSQRSAASAVHSETDFFLYNVSAGAMNRQPSPPSHTHTRTHTPHSYEKQNKTKVIECKDQSGTQRRVPQPPQKKKKKKKAAAYREGRCPSVCVCVCRGRGLVKRRSIPRKVPTACRSAGIPSAFVSDRLRHFFSECSSCN